ncbi:MAG: hypothetical protein KKD77_20340 [Gammaproteobacteria bacterium]|nr:hypothetical protein [Gammaproteobacteria bacterium]
MLNEKYSYQSHKRKKFLDVGPIEFNDMEIIGACFYQDTPYSDVFPKDIRGVIFRNCNLDNCNIPAGATVISGTNKQILDQTDGEYWIVDRDLNPIEPRDKDKYIEYGLSINPIDLPLGPLKENILYTNDPKVIKQRKIDAFLSDSAKVEAAALAAIPDSEVK